MFSQDLILLNYDGHKIEDYTQYYIHCEEKSIEYAILFNKKYSRHYGYMLNRIKDINYKILLYRRPSKLNISNSKEHIDRLYNNKLLDREENTHYYRKNIININIGLCGKKYNSKESCSLFKIYDEAQYYQMKYGGVIHTIPYEYMGIVDYSRYIAYIYMLEKINKY